MLLQKHRRHNTRELPNARAHSGIEHCQGKCKYGEISCCQRRHFEVHDGVGHATPPQFGVGIHRHCRHLLGQRAEEIQSVTPPAFSGEELAPQPPALDEIRPLHVELIVDDEELGLWSVAVTKDQYDGTWRQLTENKHPGRRTRCSLNIDATASRRVRPSSIKLKSFHLPSATAVWGRPRSGATSLCMMALDAPNFHVWSKRQNFCSSPLFLSLRVDLSKRTPSQGDGIQGAKMRTVPSGTGSMQG